VDKNFFPFFSIVTLLLRDAQKSSTVPVTMMMMVAIVSIIMPICWSYYEVSAGSSEWLISSLDVDFSGSSRLTKVF
jgi:hypothetical protein